MESEILLTKDQLVDSKRKMRWRQRKDWLAQKAFFAASLITMLLIFAILFALLIRAWPILNSRSLGELILNSTWKPMQGEFGFLPFISGTLWVTMVAMLLAAPPCLLCGIFLAEYANPTLRGFMKPLLDLLAAIPSVVYGVWGVVIIVPFVQNRVAPWVSRWLGFIPIFKNSNPTGFNIFSGGIVLAVMVAPFIIAISFEVLQAVPDGYRQAALALGATRWQALKAGVIPQSTSGLLAGIVLGASRALGETIAVLMVIGNVPQLPKSIFDAGYPLPALIANNYGEMMSIPLYDSALLAAALILLMIILGFNVLSLLLLRRIRRVR